MSMYQRLLAEFMFLVSMLQLALCLYETVSHSTRGRRVIDILLFIALLLFTSYVSALSAHEGHRSIFLVSVCLLISVLASVRAILVIRQTYRANRETLSPSSIKQALDNLNAGVLFADETGQAILANHEIGRLAGMLMGRFPQTLDELEQALAEPRRESGVKRIQTSPKLYLFPDGRVWHFHTVALSNDALPGFTQTTAQDVTELYEANMSLERENAALQEAIQKMRQMMDRIADRIREQESLSLKMRIHNDIGTSLITLSEMARSGIHDDLDKQLETLRFAVSCFSHDRAGVPDAFEDVYQLASEMGITLQLDGYLPQNETVEQLIASAASVCVTNCFRHAKGKTVSVKIFERRGVCTAEITNDGAAPKGPIIEGDGLSSLRRQVKQAGGEMQISHSPRFLLILNLSLSLST